MTRRLISMLLLSALFIAAISGCGYQTNALLIYSSGNETQALYPGAQEEAVQTNDSTGNDISLGPETQKKSITLDGIEYMIIESDIVELQTVAFGSVDFVPTYFIDGPIRLVFFLMDHDKIVYRFPTSDTYYFDFISDNLQEFYYGDINDDGLDDIIIIAKFIMGAAGGGLDPTNDYITIYIQTEDGFINSQSFEYYIRENVGHEEESFDYAEPNRIQYSYRMSCNEILEFIHSQNIEWDQYFPELGTSGMGRPATAQTKATNTSITALTSSP